MLNISETTKKLMESEVIKYPNLHEYAAHFINNDGISENAEYLPKLIIWIRKTTDDQPDCFNIDDETYDEFVCWGHNSRWGNAFWGYLVENIDHAIEVCLELARENGDAKIDF